VFDIMIAVEINCGEKGRVMKAVLNMNTLVAKFGPRVDGGRGQGWYDW
jgi:hypothetical protein